MERRKNGEDPARGCLIVEWALALPLTTAFASYTSAPVKARPLSRNETMEFRLWSSACFLATPSGRNEKPFVCLDSMRGMIRRSRSDIGGSEIPGNRSTPIERDGRDDRRFRRADFVESRLAKQP